MKWQNWLTAGSLFFLTFSSWWGCTNRIVQYNEQARDLVNQGLYQEAENALKNALQEDPENFTLHYNLAQVYTRSGQHQKAWRTFQHALSLLPDASVYDREKVYFLVKASEWEAARKLLQSLRYRL